MWMLNFIPDSYLQLTIDGFIVFGLVLLGASTLFNTLLKKWFPVISAYIYVLHIVAGSLVVIGAYFKGGYLTEMEWRQRVEQVQAKVDKAEQDSKEANKKLAKESKKKREIIIVHKASTQQYINSEVKKYDNTCIIPQSFIKAHNDAAEKQQ